MAHDARPLRVAADVDDDDPPRRRAERDPQRPPGGIERDVAGERADGDAPHDAGAHEVEDGDLAGARVGDVRVAAVGRDRGVAGLLEAAQDAADGDTVAARARGA